MADNASRDQNNVPTLLGISSSDGTSPVKIYADPVTHRLKVDTGGISGVSSITGTANQVIASASTGAVTLSLPQSIATSSTVTFGGLNLPAGSSSSASLAIGTKGTLYGDSNGIYISNGSTAGGGSSPIYYFDVNTPAFGLGNASIRFGSSTPTSTDLFLYRKGAANLRLGFAPNATPVSNTLTIGEASRPGTDTNVSGGNAIFESGLGTGNSTPSSTIWYGPVSVASGSGAQTNQQFMSLFYDSAATFAKLNIGVNNSFQTGLVLNGASGTGQLTLLSNGVSASIGSGATTLSLNTSSLSVNAKVGQYNSIATAGWGVPAIYGTGRSTGQVAAVASVATYTVGAADGSFMVSANANITAFVAGTFNVQVAYTDETNTAQTLKLNFASVTGTLGIALAAAGPYEGIPNHIRCKAATAITIATSGTFTSLTYNVECVIQQIS